PELHAAHVVVLDGVEQLLPCRWNGAPVGQRLGIAKEPRAIDARRARYLVHHIGLGNHGAARLAERRGEHIVAVDIAADSLGNDETEHDRYEDEQEVLDVQGCGSGGGGRWQSFSMAHVANSSCTSRHLRQPLPCSRHSLSSSPEISGTMAAAKAVSAL